MTTYHIKRLIKVIAFLLLFLPGISFANETKIYRVGVYDNKPIIFKNKSGNLQGLSIDVLNSVAKEEDIQFDYIHGHWKDMYSSLEKGQLDLLVGIAYSETRAKKFDYINETVINNWGVIYRRPSEAISSLEDLKGKRVAILSRSIHSKVFQNIMKEFQFDFIQVDVPTYLDGLKAADENRADAVIINRVISLLNSKDYDAVETGIIFNPVEVRMATQKGKNADLLALIDKHLKLQKNDKNSDYHQSMARWFGNPVNQTFPDWIIYTLGVIILAFIVSLVILKFVRQQVHVKTAELSESNARFRQLAENINEIFWISSPDWKEIFFISPVYEKVFGDPVENIYKSALSWLDFVHPDDRNKLVKDLEQKTNGDFSNPSLPVYRINTKNNETRWISARAYPVKDSNGNIIRVTGVAEDVTHR